MILKLLLQGFNLQLNLTLNRPLMYNLDVLAYRIPRLEISTTIFLIQTVKALTTMLIKSSKAVPFFFIQITKIDKLSPILGQESSLKCLTKIIVMTRISTTSLCRCKDELQMYKGSLFSIMNRIPTSTEMVTLRLSILNIRTTKSIQSTTTVSTSLVMTRTKATTFRIPSLIINRVDFLNKMVASLAIATLSTLVSQQILMLISSHDKFQSTNNDQLL